MESYLCMVHCISHNSQTLGCCRTEGGNLPSKNVRLRIELDQLERAAEKGNKMAAGRARLLESWIDAEDSKSAKKADDRCKVIIGAYVASELKAGQLVVLTDTNSLLRELDKWLTRPNERAAILGNDGKGSPAFIRVTR